MENRNMMVESQEAEPERPPSLFIVHETNRSGAPFGVYSASCASCLVNKFHMPVSILMTIPYRGDLAWVLRTSLQKHAVQPGLPWFDLCIEDFLTHLGVVIADEFEEQQSVRYAEMDIGS